MGQLVKEMKMKLASKEKKVGIIFLISLLFISLFSLNVLSYLGWDDAAAAGIGCIVGGTTASFTGSCTPYKPVKTAVDCTVCNDKEKFPFNDCTEYTCRAIGRNCEYTPRLDLTEGISFQEGLCVNSDVADLDSPEIANEACGVFDMSTNEFISGSGSGLPLEPGFPFTFNIDLSNLNTGGLGVNIGGNAVKSFNEITRRQVSTLNPFVCNLGELNINKQYAFILSTNEFSECRFSPTQNNIALFETELYEDTEEEDPLNIVTEKIGATIRALRERGVFVFAELPNGFDHILPLIFDPAQITPERIDTCNNGGCVYYARCSDFDGNIMDRDYVFSYTLDSGLGDISPPVIRFDPQSGAISSYANKEISLEIIATDEDGIDECRYSTQEDAFENMNLIDCTDSTEDVNIENEDGDVANIEEDNDFVKTCTISLANLEIGENIFHFKCRDLNRNTNNPFSNVYRAIVPEQLTMQIISLTSEDVV